MSLCCAVTVTALKRRQHSILNVVEISYSFIAEIVNKLFHHNMLTVLKLLHFKWVVVGDIWLRFSTEINML